MPYFLEKVKGKRNKYYVMDTSGKVYSKEPLPLARAEKQIKALHINTGHGLCGGSLFGNYNHEPLMHESSQHVTIPMIHKKRGGREQRPRRDYFGPPIPKPGVINLDNVFDDNFDLDLAPVPMNQVLIPQLNPPPGLIQQPNNPVNMPPLQILAPPLQPNDPTDMPPLQILSPPPTGQGKQILIGDELKKIRFAKKYLKGQGLPASKKNVEKICNIMDVEGVVFD
jgi:hypothetical protein